MLKGFRTVLVKELKELSRDPKILLGMIILPLLMFPVIGSIMSYSIQSAQEKAEKAPLLIVNNDGGNWSEFFINILISSSIKVSVENNTVMTNDTVSELMSNYNTTQLVEIPTGFSTNMTQHFYVNETITATLNFYAVFSGSGAFESVGSSVIDNLVSGFNRIVAPNAVNAYKSTVIKGEIKEGVDPGFLSGLMISQSIALPITIMILLTYSMQIAATSVAMEKEEKTLETLLTLPVDRFAILMGKLSGSIVVSGVGAVAYMIGFNYYMNSLTAVYSRPGASLDLVSLGLVPSLFGYFLLGVSLFVALLSALALAVIISAFAEDVRSAQSVVGYIYPLVFIPSFLLLYLDINSVPFAIRIILYAIPYSHPILASKAVIMGDYWTPVVGILYVAAFTLVVMYAASRLFATEKILTAKLKFRGLRKRRKAPVEEF